ncbi:MAG TPA: hypothetical protein VLG16_04855 [Candidatus Saccharimonadales bacterium]|nr:hypothetical protein [Candidatus Saccharimonadales bacterium]
MSIESIPFIERAGLSIEPGHYYANAFSRNATPPLADRFASTRLWVETAESELKQDTGEEASTVFLIDDYTCNFKPQRIIPQIRDAAEQSGLRIDYLAREAACVPLAGFILGQLDITDNFTKELGITRQFQGTLEGAGRWDTWDGRLQFGGDLYYKHAKNEWACAHLASVWQLLRLGVLRHPDFDKPFLLDGELPPWKKWDEVPGLIQLNPDAAPFQARETFSILPKAYIGVENLVKKIIANLALPNEASLPVDQRIHHLFLSKL